MPCECGPDERQLWERVRDLMTHHDELYDRYQQTLKENRRLKEEQDVLLRKIGELTTRGTPDARPDKS